MDSSACGSGLPARRRIGERRAESDQGNRRREARAHHRPDDRTQGPRRQGARRAPARAARRPGQRRREAPEQRHDPGFAPPGPLPREEGADPRHGRQAPRARNARRERSQRPHDPHEERARSLAPRRRGEGRARRVRGRVRARRPRRGRFHSCGPVGHRRDRGAPRERLAARRLARGPADRDHRSRRHDPAAADAWTGGRAVRAGRRRQHVHARLDQGRRTKTRTRTRSRRKAR